MTDQVAVYLHRYYLCCNRQ